MKTPEPSSNLAVGLIETWIKMDMKWLRHRRAADSVHVSPCGRFEERESCRAHAQLEGGHTIGQLVLEGF